MTQRELLYSLLLIFGVLISTVSQVLLKKSAPKEHKGIIREYLNPYVIGAYSLFVIATFITIYAFKGIPLSYGPILEGTGYFFITIFGIIFFKERLNTKKIIGIILILSGIVIYSVF